MSLLSFHYTIEPPEKFSLTLSEDGGIWNLFCINARDKMVICKRQIIVVHKRHVINSN